MGKRELIALLNLSSWCLVMVERLFLAVPRGCLQFVIVVFPDHTHLLFFISVQLVFLSMTIEKSCFVFAIFDAVVIVGLCHFNSWMEAWRCGFKFLKSKPLARIGQQNRPLNMALKALLRTCVWMLSSVSEMQSWVSDTLRVNSMSWVFFPTPIKWLGFFQGLPAYSWLLYFNCLPDVLWLVGILCLFLSVPWVGLQCVILLIPDHTHLLFEM